MELQLRRSVVTEGPSRPRTVKARRWSHRFLPIIVYDDKDGIYLERTDAYLEPSAIFDLVKSEDRSLIVVQGASRLLLALHEANEGNDLWQFRVTPFERTFNYHPLKQGTRATITEQDTVVNFLGFKRPGNQHRPNRYHHPLDPVILCNKTIDELVVTGATGVTCNLNRLEKLYTWGCNVRQWCDGNGLTASPTRGGIAAQLLKDRRFYPHPRRKIPKTQNATLRDRLPGNLYDMRTAAGTEFDRVLYLDQDRAHHNCAKDIQFPMSDHLYSRGRFVGLERQWCDGRRMDKILEGHGLFLLSVDVPIIARGMFPPPWATSSGTKTAWVYSNELPMLRELGIRPRHLIAAWSSKRAEYPGAGLNAYARWALKELDAAHAIGRTWLKGQLLATYGMLAARPSPLVVGYAQAKNGDPARYLCGSGMLTVQEKRGTRAIEPGFANVLHRGMIEAECRLRSLSMARELQSAGVRILGIYADGIITTGDEPLPMLTHPWRVDAELTHFRYLHPSGFISAELTKLPGVPSRTDILAASRGVQFFPSRRAT